MVIACALATAPIVLPACGGKTAAGVTVYVDGKLRWQGDRQALAGRPTDYERGALRGWRLYGGILTEPDRGATRRIVAMSAKGQKLEIEDPARDHPGLDPVLLTDREGNLRFMMVGDEAPTFPHGRGPGDGRGGGGRRGRHGPLALDDVVEVHVTLQDVGESAAFELRIGDERERLTLDDVARLVPAAHVPDVPGDVWPLRDLLRAKGTEDPRRISIVGASHAYTIERHEWESERLFYLRRNARGLVKFEAAQGGQGRADVGDVSRISVDVRGSHPSAVP